eukprot:3065891-Prymnesium_polylepis.1
MLTAAPPAAGGGADPRAPCRVRASVTHADRQQTAIGRTLCVFSGLGMRFGRMGARAGQPQQ